MWSLRGKKEKNTTAPWGLRWRSSVWFVTIVVGYGIVTDLLVYSIVIPVLPFHLERLNYTGISALVGWLLFSYSAGLVIATIPTALLSERYDNRRIPLIVGLVILIVAQVMLMEAPTYWLMAVARLCQGLGSTIIWVVGLALLSDTTPEKDIGRQLGFAMTGSTLGFLVGPPVGGALFSRFGFRAPMVFAMIMAAIDLLGRILVIERHEAMCWGVDPKCPREPEGTQNSQPLDGSSEKESPVDGTVAEPASLHSQQTAANEISTDGPPTPLNIPKSLSLLQVIARLARSPRALIAIFITFTYGIVFSGLEPALPLHLQAVWGLNSSKVGLVYLGSVVASLFSTPLTGWLADRHGVEWVSCISLILSLPWWLVIIIRSSLPLFIAAFALETFFTSGVICPVTAELAAIARGIEGVGYAHVYGAFNLAFGVGTSVGPVVGGQIYDHLKYGWAAICVIATSLVTACLMLAFAYMGDEPLLKRLISRIRSRGSQLEVEP